MKLGSLDAAIMLVYLTVVAFIGFWAGRREKASPRDYFLQAPGSLVRPLASPWWPAASAPSSSWARLGFAYSHGLAVANWEWLIFPALTLLIWVFTPLFIRHQVTTMPEFLERRYGVASRTIFALLTILSYAIVNLALVLYSGALVLHSIFGLDFWLCVLLLASVTGAYTIYGGLSSVVWTDVFLRVVLLMGGLLIFTLGICQVDGGFSAIIGTGDRAHLMLPIDHPTLPWTAMLVLALVTNTWY